ncbi:hypothetical protein GGQ68_001851 [Sagittula marina]|uniref:Uncharacterized protein n=1 Tax=Sagittula marina TaxID=943940 RepID=A0A7W6GSE8_9RHOB|nr:amidophosphoribosyltransferase [Sagittula marina]MBB3985518.1 hypothetical protein [Sagittula marina]
MAQDTTTSDAVNQAATQRSVGALDGLILLGTFGNDETPRALVRTSKGQTVTLKVGDRIGTAPVVAIQDGRLAYAAHGNTKWLKQPAKP